MGQQELVVYGSVFRWCFRFQVRLTQDGTLGADDVTVPPSIAEGLDGPAEAPRLAELDQ